MSKPQEGVYFSQWA